MTVNLPPQWDRIPVEGLEGIFMVIGGTDVGKSVFSRYLYERLRRVSRSVGFLDGDPGQSLLGPPATMTLATAGPKEEGFPPEGAVRRVFVGSTSPMGHMLPLLVGAAKLASAGGREGAHAVVFDTTGLIDPRRGGTYLKLAKVDLIRPSVVFAIQRDRELNDLIQPLRRSQRTRLVELPPSADAGPKGLENRQAHRREKFRRYFEGSQHVNIHWTQLAVFPSAQWTEHRLLAFEEREGYVLGLGIVTALKPEEQEAIVYTPLSTLRNVDAIRLGDVKVDPLTFSDSRAG